MAWIAQLPQSANEPDDNAVEHINVQSQALRQRRRRGLHGQPLPAGMSFPAIL